MNIYLKTMKMKTSKVKNIQGSGTFKELYVFEIEFENGDIGKVYRKEENSKLTIGESVSYTMNDKGSIKVQTEYQKRQSQSNVSDDTRQRMIIKQSSLKTATDFIIANGGTAADLMKLADSFVAYVYDESIGDNNIKSNASDDLPF